MVFQEWLTTTTRQVLSTVNTLFQETVKTVKKAAGECRQFLHAHFAGQDNIEREKHCDQLKKTTEMIKTNYQHFLQQMITATRECLNSMEHRNETASENHQQQALESRNTSFDILSDYLEKVVEMIQSMKNQINDCQEDVATEQSRVLNQDYFQDFLDNLWARLPALLFKNILFQQLFSSFAVIPSPLAAITTTISVIYAANCVIYPIYMQYRARNQLTHLEEELGNVFSGTIDMLDILGQVRRLVYSRDELQHNESSEAKSALENRIQHLLNEISLMAASFAEHDD